MDHRRSRNLPLVDLRPDAAPYELSLFGNEIGSEQRRQNHDAKRRPNPDPCPDQIEQRNFGDRDHQESKEEPGSDAHDRRVDGGTSSVDGRPSGPCHPRSTLTTMETRDLPSVDALALQFEADSPLPWAVIVQVCQKAVDDARASILAGQDADPSTDASRTLSNIEAARPQMVINATGVLLHTNLGRAVLNTAVADLAGAAAASAGNVEIDIRSGRRSSRSAYLRILLPTVTGAEDGFAVNNNAGALLLALASVAGDGARVAVSRGELIEIGGSFRLPDLMAASGATLVEVGTTNRTRPADYEAVAGSVDAILKVHPSNYRVEGFSEDVSYAELSTLARAAAVPFIADVGSGLIDENAPWLSNGDRSWLAGEPGVRQTVTAGADLVLFSGDKLFGGPQAGMMVGTREAIERATRHPVARAVRLDGPALTALAATLEMYADQRVLEIPFWAMASSSITDIEARATEVLAGTVGATIKDGQSLPGAGSVPGATIPTKLIVLPGSADAVYSELANHDPPIIARRRDTTAVIDLRSVLPTDDTHIAAAVRALLL
jgi:L-seryl-tRNA(Ser) seleniumtransferase